MRNYIIYFIILFFTSALFCDLLEVDMNGNYDHTSIVAAIEAAIDGDEILVYPGEYFENVDFLGKRIELKSLFAGTGERHYIRETIINGNSTGSCISLIDNHQEEASVTGFTLTGGSGTEYTTTNIYYGGGVYLQDSNFEVISCIIEYNAPLSVGGGIALCHESNLYLSDTVIRHNVVDFLGGGLFFYNGQSEIIFDNENRCSIYNNYAPRGSDIYCQYEGGDEFVYLDTLTAADYAGYYIYQFIEEPPWVTMNGLTVDYLHTYQELVDADLYVSPEGDDHNSGLSFDEPLKSITCAMHRIAVNPEEMHTVYLAEGVYSASNTGEKLPFQVKDCITISGESRENTTIDGENSAPFFCLNYGDHYFGMENLRFINAGAISVVNRCIPDAIYSMTFNGKFSMQNINFENNDTTNAILFLPLLNFIEIDNIIYRNNGIHHVPNFMSLFLYNDEGIHLDARLNNIMVTGNNTGKICFSAYYFHRKNFYVSNLVFTGNINNTNGYGYDVNGPILAVGDGVSCYLINSTIALNTTDNPPISSAILATDFCSVEVINSIIYDNGTDYAVNSVNYFGDHTINVHHSLIEEGINGIHGILPVIWDHESNLDCDPLFSGDEVHPLSLSEDSPCIDAGTTLMPAGFTLPETDIAGNPRIYGNGIDMGAYEYNPWVSPVTKECISSDLEYYPNPVKLTNGRGTLVVNYPGRSNEAFYELEIYNVKGQKVWGSEMKTGNSFTSWDCSNKEGDLVSTGVYFIRLKRDGEYLTQKKVTIIR